MKDYQQLSTRRTHQQACRSRSSSFRRWPLLVILGLILAWIIGVPLDSTRSSVTTSLEIALPTAEAASSSDRSAYFEASPSTLLSEDWEEVLIRNGDSLARIFSAQELSPQALHSVVSASKEAKKLERLMPGKALALRKSEDGQLVALKYPLKPTEILHVWQAEDSRWRSEIEYPTVEPRLMFAQAQIDDSLFLAGKRAGLDDGLIMEMANIYSWDIDFLQDIRPGDTFNVLYEEHYIGGEKVSNGPILATSFNNQGRSFSAFRYEDSTGAADYYSQDGKSLRKAFIRTPVNFTRISGKFDLNRKHPILHKIRAHRGVDYAAPSGTPVKATGDGKIIFSGEHGGFGNVVKIQHGQRYTTVYAHLSRFARGIKKNVSVKQGDVIGYVGMTGLATGPHLHYEFQVDGQHQNPLTVPLPKAEHINPSLMEDFKTHVAQMESLLARHARLHLAANP